MKELTEITLFDFIFSQQDRVGNIDYVDYWYWLEDDQVHRARASGPGRPNNVPSGALLLKRTHLNDNDAAGKLQYLNYTKRTGMLEKIRHYSPETYKRLIALNEDFESQGPLYHYVKDHFGLSDRQFGQIVRNTELAVGILGDTCRSGKLRFDLDPESFLLKGEVRPANVECGR